MKRFMNKKVAAIGLAAGLALGAAGAAFAYFTDTGTNSSGTVTVGTSAGLTVTPSAATGGTLYPTAIGDHNQVTDTIDYTILNNGESALQLSQAVVTVNNSGIGNGCLGSWFQVDGQAAPTGTDTQDLSTTNELAPNSDGTTVTAAPAVNGDTYYGSLTISLIDNGHVQDVCKGVTPTVTITAS